MLTALTPFSSPVLHRFTSCTPHCALPQLHSPFPLLGPHSFYAIRSTLTRRGTSVHLLLSPGLICRLLLFSHLLRCSSQCRVSYSRIFFLFFVREGFSLPTAWKSEVLRVATLLGAVAFCSINLIHSSKFEKQAIEKPEIHVSF
jgi:hypothetical protein